MITVAVVTNEKRFLCPFEIHIVDEELRLIICRCHSRRRLIKKMKKAQVCGYICRQNLNLPFDYYDGSGIFGIKIPMLVKKLVKTKNITTGSVAVVSGENKHMSPDLFESISGLFKDFYIISPDYDFACKEAERLMSELGIVAQTEVPGDGCDVEIVFGNIRCGVGSCVINYETPYTIKHGYSIPCDINSCAFAEALFANGLISKGQLISMPVSVKMDTAAEEWII